ncbi:MAG: YkvA family protein [Anaerolineae bacterium]
MKTLSRVLNAKTFLNEIWLHLRLWWRLIVDPRVPEALKLLLPAAAVVYLLWPVDILTDIIPIVGQVDDVAVLLLALRFFESLVPRHIVEEHLQRLRRGDPARRPRQSEGDVIDGEYRIL